MNPQTSPNWFSCVPTAFAITLDVPVRELLVELGHDGAEILFPNLEEPQCRRGFHWQEFIPLCLRRGLAPVMIEAMPSFADVNYTVTWPISYADRMGRYMSHFCGVVMGKRRNGGDHALAWDNKTELYYDTNGKTHEGEDFAVQEFVALIPTKLAESFDGERRLF